MRSSLQARTKEAILIALIPPGWRAKSIRSSPRSISRTVSQSGPFSRRTRLHLGRVTFIPWLWSSDSLVRDTGEDDERPSHHHAVGMPFAVVEGVMTHLGVPLGAMVITPHVVATSLDFAVHGIAAKVEDPRQDQCKVQKTHNHRSKEQRSQKAGEHPTHGVLSSGVQNIPRMLNFEAVRHGRSICAVSSSERIAANAEVCRLFAPV